MGPRSGTRGPKDARTLVGPTSRTSAAGIAAKTLMPPHASTTAVAAHDASSARATGPWGTTTPCVASYLRAAARIGRPAAIASASNREQNKPPRAAAGVRGHPGDQSALATV
jgi:hypothetical protein